MAASKPVPLLTASNLAKQYSETWVIKEASLTIRKGETILILGSNGSGKTTLLRILAGLTLPSQGRLKIQCGRKQPKSCLGYVGHTPLLYPEMTVEENIIYYSGLYGLEEYNPKDNPAWTSLGLDAVSGKRVKHLSYGWKKRADIARALVHEPRLLLLDEPFTGLDDTARARLSRLLKSLANMGIAIVMAAPRWEEVFTDMEPRVLVISDGRLSSVEGAASPA